MIAGFACAQSGNGNGVQGDQAPQRHGKRYLEKARVELGAQREKVACRKKQRISNNRKGRGAEDGNALRSFNPRGDTATRNRPQTFLSRFCRITFRSPSPFRTGRVKKQQQRQTRMAAEPGKSEQGTR